jgi:hypothetical protein
METSLTRALQKVTHDYLVVVISDGLDYTPQVLKLLLQIKRHNDVIMVRVSDPAESAFPRVRMVVGDGTYQTALEPRSKTWEKIHQSLRENAGHLADQMFRYGIPLLELNTFQHASVQLRNVLGAKSRRFR